MIMNTTNSGNSGKSLALAIALVAVLSGGLEACKKKTKGYATFEAPKTDPNGCVWNGQYLKGEVGQRCCQGGQPITTNPPEGCPAARIGDEALLCMMQGFANAATSADDVIKKAGTLISEVIPTGTGDPTTTPFGPQVGGVTTAKTTAALGSESTTNTPGLAGSAGSSAPYGATHDLISNSHNPYQDGLFGSAAGGGSGFSGSGGYGSSGSGAGGFGSVSTAAIGDAAANGLNGGKTADEANGAGAYAGSGGGGGSGGAGRSGWGGFGSDSNSAPGTPGSRVLDQTGRNPASTDVAPMGSQDPENYFSLSTSGDNLFKIVEKRYKEKSIIWVRNDLTTKLK